MSKYRETFNVNTETAHIKSQGPIERLKADDPCWNSRKVWITYEPAIEPEYPDGLRIIYVKELKS